MAWNKVSLWSEIGCQHKCGLGEHRKDSASIERFVQFGNTLRKILFNVHAYHMGLRFGFDKIEFDEYDWLRRPSFQDMEELLFGLPDKSRYGNYSTITLGHGPNKIWTFVLSCSYGTAGYSSGICVYDQTFAKGGST
ncbi:MAG: hypothetical protein EOO45_02225 [Flavobacterium sp.]|nr:MAG: hypothetical protein EOO45_02225 [Flavobacterium sp.]